MPTADGPKNRFHCTSLIPVLHSDAFCSLFCSASDFTSWIPTSELETVWNKGHCLWKLSTKFLFSLFSSNKKLVANFQRKHFQTGSRPNEGPYCFNLSRTYSITKVIIYRTIFFDHRAQFKNYVDKKRHFLDHLPNSSCPCSYWKPLHVV